MYVVMATLAENFSSFERALKGEFSMGVLICQPLEDVLIHYSHGRKIPKGQVVDDSHHAKTMQKYLETLEESGSRQVRDLYSELCEITHPAAATVHFFGAMHPSKPDEFLFGEPDDMEFIVGLLKRHDAVFVPLFQKSFNAALLSLFLLNQFSDSRIFTPSMKNVDLSRVPAFAEIQTKMKASQSKLPKKVI
jgi:hypothetical protein